MQTCYLEHVNACSHACTFNCACVRSLWTRVRILFIIVYWSVLNFIVLSILPLMLLCIVLCSVRWLPTQLLFLLLNSFNYFFISVIVINSFFMFSFFLLFLSFICIFFTFYLHYPILYPIFYSSGSQPFLLLWLPTNIW